MRGLARVLCLGIATTLCALPATTASGALRNNENVSVSGSLTYTWHGDPARGCAAAGVCDVQGELILRPMGDAQVSVFGSGHGDQIFVDVSGVVRVQRRGADPGECVDVVQTGIGLDIRLASKSASQALLNAPADSGRCAGPLATDLANMPIPFRHSGASYELSKTKSFVAGPFSGSFVSSLALRPVSNPGFGSSQSSGSTSGPTRSHAVLEQAQLSYRVIAGSNEIQTLFGAADSGCQVLDACGASGSLALLVSPPNTFTIEASRLVHVSRTRRDVLADLTHGRLTLLGGAPLKGYVDETYDWSDGSSCRDSVPTPQLQLVVGAPAPSPSRSRVPVGLNSDLGPNGEVLRTHCPGPADSDLIGQNGILAAGSVTAGELLHRRFTVTLTAPSEFMGLGYTGSRSGSIQLELTLTKVHAEARKAG
jgi:hypothetical protein